MPKPPSTRGPGRSGGRADHRKAGTGGRPRRGSAPIETSKTELQRSVSPRRGTDPSGRSERPQPKRAPSGGANKAPSREKQAGRGATQGAASAPSKPQRERRAAAFRSATGAAAPATRPRPEPRPRRAPRQPPEAEAIPSYVEGAPQRIAKLLARAGVASRREIERMILERRIAIEGVPIDTPATILTTLKGVTVDGKPVQAPSATRLFLYHKPVGLLTAERDFTGRPTIYDRLPKDLPRLMPVGRLDLNTEGLLLLTNDGEFKRQLELPSTGVERTYRARVFGDVTQDQLEELIHGVEIDGVRYGAIDANLERRTGRNGWVEMRLKEGKNREVRRVLEYLGLQVSRLLRVAYGPFLLGDLPVGGVGEVRQHDLAEFRKSLR